MTRTPQRFRSSRTKGRACWQRTGPARTKSLFTRAANAVFLSWRRCFEGKRTWPRPKRHLFVPAATYVTSDDAGKKIRSMVVVKLEMDMPTAAISGRQRPAQAVFLRPTRPSLWDRLRSRRSLRKAGQVSPRAPAQHHRHRPRKCCRQRRRQSRT